MHFNGFCDRSTRNANKIGLNYTEICPNLVKNLA